MRMLTMQTLPVQGVVTVTTLCLHVSASGNEDADEIIVKIFDSPVELFAFTSERAAIVKSLFVFNMWSCSLTTHVF